jgi:hypothetical protein
VLGRDGITGIVVLVHDARGNATNRRHDAIYHKPRDAVGSPSIRQGGVAAQRATKSIVTHCSQSPDEQGEEEDYGNRCSDIEELLETVRPDPDERERDDGKDDIGHKICRCHAGALGHCVWDVLLKIGVPSEENDIDTFPSYPRCEAVPNQRQKDAVPKREPVAPHSPYRTVDDRKAHCIDD